MTVRTIPKTQSVLLIKGKQMVQPLWVKRVEIVYIHMTSIGSFCTVYPVLIDTVGRPECIYKHGMFCIVGKKLITPGVICTIVNGIEIIGTFVVPK